MIYFVYSFSTIQRNASPQGKLLITSGSTRSLASSKSQFEPLVLFEPPKSSRSAFATTPLNHNPPLRRITHDDAPSTMSMSMGGGGGLAGLGQATQGTGVGTHGHGQGMPFSFQPIVQGSGHPLPKAGSATSSSYANHGPGRTKKARVG